MEKTKDRTLAPKLAVSTREALVIWVRLTALWLVVALVIATPFLLWDFFWHGVIPALSGAGTGAMSHEWKAVLGGPGIKVAGFFVIGVIPYVAIVELPGRLRAIAERRLGAGAAGAGADDDETSFSDSSHEFQMSPYGNLTPGGLPIDDSIYPSHHDD